MWLPRIAAALAAILAADATADPEFVALARKNTLVRFELSHPERTREIALAGVGGELLGIDANPNDGVLYGISDASDLYRIDPHSGKTELVSTLTAGFEGTPRSAFDFNPQADRLRLIASSGQSLRVHVGLGAVAVDGSLAYLAGDPNRGARPRITAAAYTRNLARASATQLFDIDSDLDVLALQDPPNDGGLRTVGPLGIDFGPTGGFDIVSGPGSERGYALSGTALYAIDLESGRARPLGTIATLHAELIGLAALPPSPKK